MTGHIIKASADVGNSSTKVILTDGANTRARKQPTVISFLPTIPRFEDCELDALVANLHKNIIVHITSKAVMQNGLYAVGDTANNHDGVGFNIQSHKKAERDMTVIQPFAMIAVTAIQNEFSKTGVLPASLTLDVEYVSAIPVVDYSKVIKKALEDRLKGNHVLIIYVGEDERVNVTINVTDARVVQEGIPAFYALINGKQSWFTKYNETYGESYTGNDFAKRKLLFVDIGDGTIELIFIENGQPVVKKSGGARLGVGHASEKASKAFVDRYNFNDDIPRATYMEKVLNKKDKWHVEAKHMLKDAVFEQEQKIYDAIVNQVERVLSHDIDDLVIFGGGTNIFTNLEKQLIKYANRFKMRVLWVDGKDSSLLNAIGLDDLNNKLFFKKKGDEQ